MKHFSKTVILLSAVFVLTLGAGFTKADTVSASTATATDVIFAIQEQIYNLKVQLLKLQIDNLQKQFLAAASDATNPALTTTSISPSSATVGGSGFTMTVNGTGFVSGVSIVYLGPGAPFVYGANKPTTYISSTELTAAIPASDLTAAGTFSVVVFNNGAISNAQTFTVNAVQNIAPTITSISPLSTTAGGTAFTLIVNGTGFMPGPAGEAVSVVRWDGSDRTTIFYSSTQLSALLYSADLTTVGTFPITVFNPAPGGGTSNSQTFTVNGLTSVSPGSVPVGSPDTTITVNGSGFTSGSVVKYSASGTTKSASITSVSPIQLTAVIPAADLTNPKTFNITVSNLAPGGGTSNAVQFAVGAITITSITPKSITPSFNSGDITITINGTNFLLGAFATFQNTSEPPGSGIVTLTTTYVSPTQLTVVLPDSLSGGTFNIRVNNPGINTPSSLPVLFTIEATPPISLTLSPQITNISPASVTVGSSGFDLTIDGSSFIFGSSSTKVGFCDNEKTPYYISSTRVIVSIPASDIVYSKVCNVYVKTFARSNYEYFHIYPNNPSPTITNISPGLVTVGNPFTLTVNGTNFINGAQIDIDSNADVVSLFRVYTVFISPTQLTTNIPFLLTPTTRNVTVQNPGAYPPGQGVSNIKTLAVQANPNPDPVIVGINPQEVEENQIKCAEDDQEITVTGYNFSPTSVINLNGSPIATTTINSISLGGEIPLSEIESVATYSITVTNPSTNKTSQAKSFKVTPNPAPPNITKLSPQSKVVSASSFTLEVTAFSSSNLSCQSKITWDDNFLNAYISGSFDDILSAVIPTSYLTATGTHQIKVYNPEPGGGYSNSLTFFVDDANTFEQNIILRTPSTTSQSQTSNIQSQIVELQKQLDVKIQEESKNISSVSPTTNTSPVAFGQRNDSIKNLQILLNTHGFPVAATGNGSSGNETNYFGLLTQEALRNFQEANGLLKTSVSSGMFGPWTRAIIQEKYGVSL